MSEARLVLGLRVVGLVAIALSITLLILLPAAPVHEVPQGYSSPVVGLELAREPEHVIAILGEPEHPAREATVAAMDLGNQLDFAFMLAYAAFHALLAGLLFVRSATLVSPMPRAALGVMLALSLTMAVGDGIENVCLLRLSPETDRAAMLAPLATLYWATRIKWVALFSSSALLSVGTSRELTPLRWAAVPFGLAALLGAVSLLWPLALELGSLLLGVGWLLTLALVRARAR